MRGMSAAVAREAEGRWAWPEESTRTKQIKTPVTEHKNHNTHKIKTQ